MRHPRPLLAVALPLALAACDGGGPAAGNAPAAAPPAVAQALDTAAGTLTDPAGGASCAGNDVRITRDHFDLVLEGNCGEVVITASNGAVNVSNAASIRVEGSQITVLNAQVGTVEVSGSDNTLNLTRVGPLTVSGDNNLVLASEIASVVFSGHGNTANPDNTPPLQDSGSGNRLM